MCKLETPSEKSTNQYKSLSSTMTLRPNSQSWKLPKRRKWSQKRLLEHLPNQNQYKEQVNQNQLQVRGQKCKKSRWKNCSPPRYSYLDRYYQNATSPVKSPQKSVKSANTGEIFKWKNPQMKHYFTNQPRKSIRQHQQPEQPVNKRLEEIDVR